MAKVISYKDLLVWQRGMDLVVMCYKLTERFPASERLGLTFQLRKSSVSIPSNVAEGNQRRRSTAAYLHHISIALGSEGELETQLEASRRLGFCSDADIAPVVEATEEVGRLLNGLADSLERRTGREQQVFTYRAPGP
jgi:four helix bundle protein